MCMLHHYTEEKEERCLYVSSLLQVCTDGAAFHPVRLYFSLFNPDACSSDIVCALFLANKYVRGRCVYMVKEDGYDDSGIWLYVPIGKDLSRSERGPWL